jgi:hypothetical protein
MTSDAWSLSTRWKDGDWQGPFPQDDEAHARRKGANWKATGWSVRLHHTVTITDVTTIEI